MILVLQDGLWLPNLSARLSGGIAKSQCLKASPVPLFAEVRKVFTRKITDTFFAKRVFHQRVF
jgi:hypothetical protein